MLDGKYTTLIFLFFELVLDVLPESEALLGGLECLFPTVQGSKVSLRMLRRPDWPLVYRWVRNRRLADLMTHDAEAYDLRRGLYWGIHAEQTGFVPSLIGYVGVHDWDEYHQTAELTICIGEPSHWDQGFGTDALSALRDYLFKHAGLNSVYLRVLRTNARALRCYEKCGFRKVGILKAGKRAEQGWRDIILMEFDRSMWLAPRSTKKTAAS